MEIVWQPEDSLREKKVESDLKDLLKTLVAFANSVAPGDTAQVFIGEKDDGTVQGVTNTDSVQKKIRDECDKIYPEIYYRTEVYERDGKLCVRVDIKQNGLAPHFGGPAWVRRGSVVVKANEELYQQLIDLRSSKLRDLVKWLGKLVTVSWTGGGRITGPNWTKLDCELVKATARFCTFRKADGQQEKSEPTDWLDIGWDDEKGRPRIYVHPDKTDRRPW